MNWFFIALSAPVLWAFINHIDKFIVSKYASDKNPGSLVIFTSMTAGLASFFIFFLAPLQNVSLLQAFGGIVAGFLFIAGYIPYMYALQEDEVSITAPLFQMISPFAYVLGAVFLGEFLSGKQILAGLLVITGAVVMTLNFDNLVWKGRLFKLMAFASLLLALNTVVFKVVGLGSSFWTASFWEYLGAFIFGIILFCIPSYNKDFRFFLKNNGIKILSLSFFAESLNAVARTLSNFAALLVPIALVYIVNGTQPLFIFIYGIFLFLFFPKIEAENFSRKHLLIKLSAIFIMIFGSVLLFL
jgi:transporter family protein